MIRLELSWPPSANKQYGLRGNRPYSAKAVKAYRKTVAAICMMERVKPLEGELICGLQLHPRKSWPGDTDNLWKVLLDALQKAGCYKNDRQIKTQVLDVCATEDEGRILCVLYPRAGVKRLELIVGKGCLIHKT